MEDYRLQIKVKNNYFLSMITKKGYSSVGDFCRKNDLGQTDMGKIANLKIGAYRKDGTLFSCVEKACDILLCMPEDIFPAEHLENPLEKNSVEILASKEDVVRIAQAQDPLLSIEQAEASTVLDAALKSCLSAREINIISLRFGLDGEQKTLQECGDIHGLSRDRIRQIECKALRKMRNPKHEDLREYSPTNP